VSGTDGRRHAVISLLKEYLEFLREERKTWMLVIVALLLLVGVLVTVTSSAIAPFIYALF
jgi:hypothetical protein